MAFKVNVSSGCTYSNMVDVDGVPYEECSVEVQTAVTDALFEKLWEKLHTPDGLYELLSVLSPEHQDYGDTCETCGTNPETKTYIL